MSTYPSIAHNPCRRVKEEERLWTVRQEFVADSRRTSESSFSAVLTVMGIRGRAMPTRCMLKISSFLGLHPSTAVLTMLGRWRKEAPIRCTALTTAMYPRLPRLAVHGQGVATSGLHFESITPLLYIIIPLTQG
jgi:hypothetical protein